jgi:hypothetical protein
VTDRARTVIITMGDKSPKSKAKNKKQGSDQKKEQKAAHDKKQAPPPNTSIIKSK